MTDVILINTRYRLQEKLGEGGMGAVYRATDRLTGQTVALKRVTASGDQLQFASQSTDQEFRLSLAVEFRTLAGLRHPHIVSVLDYGFDSQRQPYFAMQLIEKAQTLTEYAARLDIAGKVRVLGETLQALAYLHQRGIIHRDLKPANVLVTADGAVKVMDFGLALHQSDSITNLYTSAVGTLAYMAPELLQDEPASIQSDLYAVGVMAYELFVGKYPFNVKNIGVLVTAILNERPDMLALPADLPDLETVLAKLLAKSPMERYTTADAVMEALCAATGQPVPPENAALRESYLQAARFVGRDAELGQLVTALDGVMKGNGSAWLIGGESGVGKSRLLDELSIRALVEGAVVLRGQAVEGGGLPYQLWRDSLRQLVLSTELSDLEAGILREIVTDINHLLNRNIPDVPALEGQAGQQRLVLTIAEVFKRQTQPVVLLLEDLQWTGESRILLQRLNELMATQAILIVGTYRNDETPTLPDDLPGMQLMTLARLSDAAIEELSVSMLGETGKQPALVDLLKRETEGNTFFMVETVRALAEDAGRLAEIGKLPLPTKVTASGVESVVRRRLNRLPDLIQQWLKRAAVIGRQLDLKVLETTGSAFADDLVQSLIGHSETDPVALFLMQNMAAPVQEEMLALCASAAVLEVVAGTWRFSHDKIRELILHDLTETERQTLNRQVAKAIETVHPDDDAYAEILMNHWREAKSAAKEVHYILKTAPDYILVRNKYLEGIQLLERGKSQLEGIQDAEFMYVQIANLIAEAQERAGEYQAARQNYEEALQRARLHSNEAGEADALNGLSWLDLQQGKYEEADALSQQSITLYQKLNNLKGQMRAAGNRAAIAYNQGNLDAALTHLQNSLELARSIQDRRATAVALSNIGMVYLDHLRYEDARIVIAEALTIGQETGNNAIITLCLSVLAGIAYHLNDYATSRKYTLDSNQLLEKMGDRMNLAMGLSHLGELDQAEGNYLEARDHHEACLRLSQEIGSERNVAFSHYFLALIALELHEFENMHSHLIASLRLASTLGDLQYTLKSVIGMVRWLVVTERADKGAVLLGAIAEHSGINDFNIAATDLKDVRDTLAVSMSPEKLTTALEQGKSLELDTVVQQILAEYGDSAS